MKVVELKYIFGLFWIGYIDSAKIVAFKFLRLMKLITNIVIVIVSPQVRVEDILPDLVILKDFSALLESFGHIDIDPLVLPPYDVLIGFAAEKEGGKDQYRHRDKMFVLCEI